MRRPIPALGVARRTSRPSPPEPPPPAPGPPGECPAPASPGLTPHAGAVSDSRVSALAAAPPAHGGGVRGAPGPAPGPGPAAARAAPASRHRRPGPGRGASGRPTTRTSASTPGSPPSGRRAPPPASCFPPALPALARRGPDGPPTPAWPRGPAARAGRTSSHPLACARGTRRRLPRHTARPPRPARGSHLAPGAHLDTQPAWWPNGAHITSARGTPVTPAHDVTPAQCTQDSKVPDNPRVTPTLCRCHAPGHNLISFVSQEMTMQCGAGLPCF